MALGTGTGEAPFGVLEQRRRAKLTADCFRCLQPLAMTHRNSEFSHRNHCDLNHSDVNVSQRLASTKFTGWDSYHWCHRRIPEVHTGGPTGPHWCHAAHPSAAKKARAGHCPSGSVEPEGGPEGETSVTPWYAMMESNSWMVCWKILLKWRSWRYLYIFYHHRLQPYQITMNKFPFEFQMTSPVEARIASVRIWRAF